MTRKQSSRASYSAWSTVAGCLLLLVAVGAGAAVDDPPYIELYPSGDATQVNVCGTLSCGAEYDVIVSTTTILPVESDVEDTFLRVQNKDKDDVEGSAAQSGYNTSNTDLQDDVDYENQARPGLEFNHAVLVSSLQSTTDTDTGIEYFQILLDLDEGGEDGAFDFLKLDEFEVHLSTLGTLGSYNPEDGLHGEGIFDGADAGQYVGKVFDMDYWADSEGGNNPGIIDPLDPNSSTVDHDALDCCGGLILEDGVGSLGTEDDYIFYLPVALFEDSNGDLLGDTYMHIVASFGELCGTLKEAKEAAKDKDNSTCDTVYGDDPYAFVTKGYEEFSAVTKGSGANGVPIPGTALLFGLGLFGLCSRRWISAS
jgi:hypothetical protein